MWYPTVLLPSQGVRWESIDESCAHATLIDGTTTASLTFNFDREGLITAMSAESRPRTSGAKTVNAPWRARAWGYELHHGMHIPIEGEVFWLLSGRPYPYWRARVTGITYEFAGE